MERGFIVTRQLEKELAEAVSACRPDRIFILTDENTQAFCRPCLDSHHCMADAKEIVVKASDKHKNLDTLAQVWTALGNGRATRHSLLVCLGGGMVSDLGGFAASTFKRGIPFIHIPTTLLAMVDASIGGKTGINFNGAKNEVGTFAMPFSTIVHPPFLRTLSARQLLEGYAEMLKHGLLSDRQAWSNLLTFDMHRPDVEIIGEMVENSLQTKARIVTADPKERGIRKALNLGHTIGHGIETWDIARTAMPHGFAVAHGLVGALYLSVVLQGFPTENMRQTVAFIREHYGRPAFTCNDYETLIALMKRDKKNSGDEIRMVLLSDIGKPITDVTVDEKNICEALDFIREG
ncbi:MAG: 3-dehydroquinate synthase [Prevotella sp.]|nr:3-dehydroquinate synthase [Prevotella sp.]